MPVYFRMIPGWGRIGAYYSKVLSTLPASPVIVEVGVWQGRSAIYLAELLRESGREATFHLVDSFDGGSILSGQVAKLPMSLRDILEAHIEAAGVRKQITSVIALPSIAASKKFDNLSIDLAFIDADHYYESVKADLQAWWPKVKIGGVLSGHDYISGWRGVSQAVDEIVAEHQLDFRVVDDVWEIRKRACNACDLE